MYKLSDIRIEECEPKVTKLTYTQHLELLDMQIKQCRAAWLKRDKYAQRAKLPWVPHNFGARGL